MTNTQATSGPEETLDSSFWPGDGTMLKRYRIRPPAPYQSPYPTVLLIPPAECYSCQPVGEYDAGFANCGHNCV